MKLPEYLREKFIKGMKVNDGGWAYPIAMYANINGDLYLNGNSILFDTPNEVARMEVWRDEDGYTVSVRKCQDKRWVPGEFMKNVHPIPVHTLITWMGWVAKILRQESQNTQPIEREEKHA